MQCKSQSIVQSTVQSSAFTVTHCNTSCGISTGPWLVNYNNISFVFLMHVSVNNFSPSGLWNVHGWCCINYNFRVQLNTCQGCRKVVKNGGGGQHFRLLVLPYTSRGVWGACPPENLCALRQLFH